MVRWVVPPSLPGKEVRSGPILQALLQAAQRLGTSSPTSSE
jgi:hypothetical protein